MAKPGRWTIRRRWSARASRWTAIPALADAGAIPMRSLGHAQAIGLQEPVVGRLFPRWRMRVQFLCGQLDHAQALVCKSQSLDGYSRVGGCGCNSYAVNWTMRRRWSARASRWTASSRVGGCGCIGRRCVGTQVGVAQGRGRIGTQVGHWASAQQQNSPPLGQCPTLSFLVSITEHLETSRFRTCMSNSGRIQLLN
jgi:hypothetical protein